MKYIISVIDEYYNQMEDKMFYRMADGLLGPKYSIVESTGKGTISRIVIDKGMELSIWESSSTIERSFDNRKFEDNIIEISHCYNGNLKVETYPNKKRYNIEKGDLCYYKMPNDIDYFKFYYKDFSGISMHIDLDRMKDFVNPTWKDQIIKELEELLDNIFNNDILTIDKTPCIIKVIVEEIKNIPLQNMIDLMKIKAKAMEFLIASLQYKINTFSNECNLIKEEIDIIYKGENILLKNLQNPPSVNDLAKELNITVYKLQKGFKGILGNTVYEHIKRLRMEKSKELLKNTGMPIICIASEVGYENPSKFSSVFKSYMNMTPSEYRQINI